jgi:hypothetical protein
MSTNAGDMFMMWVEGKEVKGDAAPLVSEPFTTKSAGH